MTRKSLPICSVLLFVFASMGGCNFSSGRHCKTDADCSGGEFCARNICLLPTPGTPTHIQAVAGLLSATVNWNAPTDGGAVAKYTVTAQPGNATVVVTGGTQGTVAGLANGTTYTFTVLATNSNGDGPTSIPSNAVVPYGVTSLTNSSIYLSPSGAYANGKAAVGVRVQLRDTDNFPIAGQPVTLSVSGTGNTVSAPMSLTDSKGMFAASITSTVAESKTISVSAGGVSISNVATFTAPCTGRVGLPTPAQVELGAGPLASATVDVNGDLLLDIVILTDSQTIHVLLNKGDGTFSPPDSYATGNSPGSLAAGDLNRDNRIDLVVANKFDGNVSVYLNLGAGKFAPAVNYPTDSMGYPQSVAIGDLNGDQRPDLAVSNSLSSSVSILLGSGSGTFSSQVSYPTGLGNSEEGGLVLGDFKNRGMSDLAVVNAHSANVALMFNQGGGTFSAPSLFSAASNPSSIVSADFDGDGKVDLAIAEVGAKSIEVFGNLGLGVFGLKYTVTTEVGAFSMVVSDINADGKNDLAFLDGNLSVFPSYTRPTILMNSGSFHFGQINLSTSWSPYRSLNIGDVSSHGRKDIVVTTRFNDYGAAMIFPQAIDGTFSQIQDYQIRGTPPTGFNPVAAVVDDFNTDGAPDIAVVSDEGIDLLVNLGTGGFFRQEIDLKIKGGSQLISIDLNDDGLSDFITRNQNNLLDVLIQSKPLTFKESSYSTGKFDPATYSPQLIAVGDINSDGFPDIVVGNSGEQSIGVFLNSGNGTFGTQIVHVVSGSPQLIELRDLNGDGLVDVLSEVMTPLGDITLAVLLNGPDGMLAHEIDSPAKGITAKLSIEDINGDGRNDVIALSNNSVSVLINQGNGSFGFPVAYPTASHPLSLAVADLDGDNFPDMVVGSFSDSSIGVFFNQGNGTYGSRTDYPQIGFAGSLSVIDVDGNGTPDILANTPFGFTNVFTNKGNRTFGVRQVFHLGDSDSEVTRILDFNGDGRPDIVSIDPTNREAMVLQNVCIQ